MDITELRGWVETGKVAMDMVRSAVALLPKGEKRDELEKRIESADVALRTSNARLAQEMKMRLCDCGLPPYPMLWREAEKAHVCTNPACGRTIKRGMQISAKALAASGPSSWMA